MKKLLFYLFSALSLLGATSVKAVIWSRTFWSNPKGQIVEIWYDTHAEYFSKNVCGYYGYAQQEQEDLLISNCVNDVIDKQRKDAINYWLSYEKNIQVVIEDTYPLYKHKYPDRYKLPYSFLYGLDFLLKKSGVAYNNVEFRDQRDSSHVDKEISVYADGPLLADYYNKLEGWERVEEDYLFDCRLVHTIFTNSGKGVQRQIFVGGCLHGLPLAVALSVMGYVEDKEKRVISDELQKILKHGNTDSEVVIVREFEKLLGHTFDEMRRVRSEFGSGARGRWAAAFAVTHPIDLSTLRSHDESVDKERMAKKEAESTPKLRSRL